MNKGCEHKFRVPEYKFNSIIRNNPNKQECNQCKNKKLLAQSTLVRYNKRTDQKPGKYTPKNKSGLNGRKTPKQNARDNADLWFSRYIRCKYHFQILPDGTVLCKCIITGTVKEAKKMDNGHCFSRRFLLTRYEEDNCRPQNRSSNRFSGEADHYKFRDNLKKEIGEERFGRLDELRKQEGKDTVEFYRNQSEKYRKLVNELVKEKQIKKWW